jgi:hypothetical protein
MEKLTQTYSGPGELIFGENESAAVNYLIDEFHKFSSDGMGGQLPTTRDSRGRITNPHRHPDWHPIASLQSGQPFTLVMSDGRKSVEAAA